MVVLHFILVLAQCLSILTPVASVPTANPPSLARYYTSTQNELQTYADAAYSSSSNIHQQAETDPECVPGSAKCLDEGSGYAVCVKGRYQVFGCALQDVCRAEVVRKPHRASVMVSVPYHWCSN